MSEQERSALIEAVYNVLWKIHDQDELVKIALVTGFSLDELRDLGGL